VSFSGNCKADIENIPVSAAVSGWAVLKGLTAAPRRLKPRFQGLGVIAAVNRCATQKQAQKLKSTSSKTSIQTLSLSPENRTSYLIARRDWCRLEMREIAATIMLERSCMVATSFSSKALGDEESTSKTPNVRR
jgi:hypothetical protein